MKFRSKALGIGAVVVVLFVIGFSQLQAQSSITLESLSGRITTLTRRITALSNNKADRSEVRALETRVVSLEAKARLETPRPSPTATPSRLRPTSTPSPTRIRPTASPTPAQASVTTTRGMNIRSGPSTSFSVVDFAGIGEKFLVTGKNADGSWWRIVNEGQNVWIYAGYVSATNTDRVGVVPAPTPAPTTRSAAVPTVTLQERTTLLAIGLIFFDQEAMGTREQWMEESQSLKNRAVALASNLLTEVALYCDLSLDDAATLVSEYGTILDNVGYTARNGLPVRQILMFALVKYAEEYPNRTRSCDDLFNAAATSVLEGE